MEENWQTWAARDASHWRIVIHPRNPDVLYVAALGICGANAERGFTRRRMAEKLVAGAENK